jgi:hypothetical protein
MAEASIPVPSTPPLSEADQIAPSSVKGWSYFQHEMNVVLPNALSKVQALLAEATRMLSG